LFVDNINSLNGYTDENPKIKKWKARYIANY
jgi:hypothetical protein